ncbi:hypothetical protein TanjilG_13692 [Lupinus angustifolius]|uniref:Uncharacterized protein n=1 Tax=Lupinus angustifolius TaxID=3871 RepID=A0A1J7GWV6_LUPAN|nr:hypothetical protein TanjilG_13692 [Lupinus angustifolius]
MMDTTFEDENNGSCENEVMKVYSNKSSNEPDIMREDSLNKDEVSILDNKRKSAYEFDAHDSIAENEGNQKSSRQRSWT